MYRTNAFTVCKPSGLWLRIVSWLLGRKKKVKTFQLIDAEEAYKLSKKNLELKNEDAVAQFEAFLASKIKNGVEKGWRGAVFPIHTEYYVTDDVRGIVIRRLQDRGYDVCLSPKKRGMRINWVTFNENLDFIKNEFEKHDAEGESLCTETMLWGSNLCLAC